MVKKRVAAADAKRVKVIQVRAAADPVSWKMVIAACVTARGSSGDAVTTFGARSVTGSTPKGVTKDGAAVVPSAVGDTAGLARRLCWCTIAFRSSLEHTTPTARFDGSTMRVPLSCDAVDAGCCRSSSRCMVKVTGQDRQTRFKVTWSGSPSMRVEDHCW